MYLPDVWELQARLGIPTGAVSRQNYLSQVWVCVLHPTFQSRRVTEDYTLYFALERPTSPYLWQKKELWTKGTQ